MRNFSIDIIWAKIQIAITALGGWLGYFLGGMDGLLIALLVFVILDYVTGVMRAIADHELSSAIGFKGICRKVLIFALVGVGHVLDTHVVGTGSALRSAVICFYLSNEGVSLLENASHLGLPVPEKLKEILSQLHNRSDKEDKGDGA
jgi:toxin secretion/phage lysis holin